MSGSDSMPAMPNERRACANSDFEGSKGPGYGTSDASTALDAPSAPSLDECDRISSLHSASEPHHNTNSNSTPHVSPGKGRNPVYVGSPFDAGNSVVTQARALAHYHHRMRVAMKPRLSSPASPTQVSPVTGPNGLPGTRRKPPGMRHPDPPLHTNSGPVAMVPSLCQRRASKLGMGPQLSNKGGSSAPASSFKLSDITGAKPGEGKANIFGQSSKLDDYKHYIDAEKGWITFDGTATITGTGVYFANGQTFKLSLDEVDKLDELGKGKYGTVYMVRHAKPSMRRCGQGPSGPRLKQAHSDPAPARPVDDVNDTDGTTGKVMAMKEIRLELDSAQFTAILKELLVLHECVSPYIIDFYGAFFQDGAVYMCIEYMDGGSIDKLYDGGIPESILRKIAYSTVLGLKTLKDDHNIMHRDVKPTNVLVNTRGQIKMCDFGISGTLVASRAKTDIGCHSYMAPERISSGSMTQSGNAGRTYNVQSDVWSLGLTLAECAMGRYPYPPDESLTIFGQLNAIVEGDPPDLPSEGYSEEARDFVRSCLHKIPNNRPTYAMLLQHPWLKLFSKSKVIADGADEAEKVGKAVGRIQLGRETEDVEMADWVKAVLKGKHDGAGIEGASLPPPNSLSLDQRL